MAGTRRRRRQAKHHVVLLNRARPFYDRMLEEQGGGCGICGKAPNPKRRLDIDHDHGSMKIRGLLCPRCNILLGRGKDSSWYRAAAEYLERGGFPWLEAELDMNVRS
jgi:hypothetical protein